MGKHQSVKHIIFVCFTVLSVVIGVSGSFSVARATQPSEGNVVNIQQEEANCNAVAFSSSNVNQLRGPDARFGTYRVLYSGHHVSIGGKFISPADEALWWLIGDGSWIPSDAVATDGDCENVRLYTFEELFGLGINFDAGLIDECVGTTEEDVEQHESPSDESPTQTALISQTDATPQLNFTINAQLVITSFELTWWLLDTGLWVPTTLLSTAGPCDTVPLIRPDDLEMLDVDPETGDVDVCTVMAEGQVPLYDEPMGEASTLVSFENALLTNTFWAETAVAKFTDATGAIWWQLASGQWVKGADVIIHGPCRDLPEANPDVESPTICLIRATQRGVRVRVGPGLNRGVFTALPENQDFAVLGQHTSGGLLWWQIDDSTLDPDDIAASLWVSDSAVEKQGNCDDVPQTDAPIVRGTTNTGSGGNGQWGACGSCDSCGYPTNECVTSPDGQCLWDPTTCRGIGGGAVGTSDCFTITPQNVPSNGGSIVVLTPTNCTFTIGARVGNGYSPGTSVNVRSLANPGFTLAGWSGCGASGMSAGTSFVMNSSCVLTATWR